MNLRFFNSFSFKIYIDDSEYPSLSYLNSIEDIKQFLYYLMGHNENIKCCHVDLEYVDREGGKFTHHILESWYYSREDYIIEDKEAEKRLRITINNQGDNNAK